MTLKEYRDKFGVTFAYLQRKLGISNMHMQRLVNGRVRPSRELALDIEKHTNGHVPANQWWPQ